MSDPNQTKKTKAPQGSTQSSRFWIGSILAVAALGVGYLFWQRSVRTTDAPTPTDDPTPPEVSEPAPEASGESQPIPQTAALVIRANVTAATVYLDGERLGEAPQSVKELKPGVHQVKVEKEGYKPFQQEVKLTSGRRVLRAELVSMNPTASLRVTSNVPGANVLLDGKPRGSTPLALQDIAPGSHELVVSKEGYETHAETFDLGGGAQTVAVDLRKPSDLQASVGVKHKHGIPTRSCEGVLRVTNEGIEYDVKDEDRFSAPFLTIERLELKGKNLNVKIRNGRNYSFSAKEGDEAALSTFHDQVKAGIDKMKRMGT